MQKPATGEVTGGSSDSEVNEDVPLLRTKELSVIQLSREEAAVLEQRSVSRASSTGQPSMQQPQPQQQPGPLVQPSKPAQLQLPVQSQQMTQLQQQQQQQQQIRKREEEEEEEAEALKDVFPLGAGDLLLDSADDLVDSIMKEEAEEEVERVGSSANHPAHHQAADELTDILSTMPTLPNMDCHDVEDLFKGVLTDESQESQSADSSSVANHFPVPVGPAVSVRTPVANQLSNASPSLVQPVQQQPPQQLQQQQQPQQQQPPPCSPYFSEYSSSPSFSPAFSEPPPSPWPSAVGGGGIDHDDLAGGGPSGGGATANQRNALKWEADESLGLGATISAVLYANTNHPELKRDFPGMKRPVSFRV